MDSVLNCLMTDSIGSGDYLEKFMKLARETIGFEFGIALRSLWTALSIAIDTLGLEEGAVVAVPALSPSYYLSVLKSKKMSPLFVDHDPFTGIVDIKNLNELVPKPSAFILYEALGIIPFPESAMNIGIPIIEDISTSFGARIDEIVAGSIGRIAILSLENGSLIPSGGGAIVFSNHKRESMALKNLCDTLPLEVIMTDYNAALGYSQIKEIDVARRKRKELHALFAQSLVGTRHSTFIQPGEGEQAFCTFPVSIASGMKEIRVYAKKKEVDTEVAFDMSAVAMEDFPDDICPHAHSLLMRTVLFPLHQRIGSSEATKIVRVLSSLP